MSNTHSRIGIYLHILVNNPGLYRGKDQPEGPRRSVSDTPNQPPSAASSIQCPHPGAGGRAARLPAIRRPVLSRSAGRPQGADFCLRLSIHAQGEWIHGSPAERCPNLVAPSTPVARSYASLSSQILSRCASKPHCVMQTATRARPSATPARHRSSGPQPRRRANSSAVHAGVVETQ